jgi:hypothetical protein
MREMSTHITELANASLDISVFWECPDIGLLCVASRWEKLESRTIEERKEVGCPKKRMNEQWFWRICDNDVSKRTELWLTLQLDWRYPRLCFLHCWAVFLHLSDPWASKPKLSLDGDNTNSKHTTLSEAAIPWQNGERKGCELELLAWEQQKLIASRKI